MSGEKIKPCEKLQKLLAREKRRGKTVVFTNGCFDILHLGHVSYLEKASALGDVLVVAINSDASVRKLKGKGRPLHGQRERALVLAALECVDYVTIFSQSTPLSVIKALKPDVLVKGGDWRTEHIVGKDFVESYGGKVKSLAFVKGYSTTGLIAKIRKP